MTAVQTSLPDNLREKYLTQLSSRRTELAQFLAHFEQGAAPPGECAATRIHAHSLKGTGQTYGYPDISATGRALEDAMDSGTDQLTGISGKMIIEIEKGAHNYRLEYDLP